MKDLLQFALIGLGVGSAYALFAQGICLATNTQEVVIARGGFERASAVGSYRAELGAGLWPCR